MDDIIREQIDYYRARAPEYDDWFYRRGRFDQGEALNQVWFDEIGELVTQLRAQGSFRRVLELACGTGIWTEQLAPVSEQIIAVDTSPEVIEINRARVHSPRVTYWLKDIFSWEPGEEYDLVFFAFWLSHVPSACVDEFFLKIRRAMRRDGRFFMIDSMPEGVSTVRDHPEEADQPIHRRTLKDGRQFNVVKLFYPPADLQARLASVGLDATIGSTPRGYFLVGSGSKSKS